MHKQPVWCVVHAVQESIPTPLLQTLLACTGGTVLCQTRLHLASGGLSSVLQSLNTLETVL